MSDYDSDREDREDRESREDSQDSQYSLEADDIDPYAVLGVDRTATAEQVRTAYRKAALKCHPDKVAPDARDYAHDQFHELALAYAVLSDTRRRAHYDATGSTAESIDDADGFDWADFYRNAYKDAVNGDSIKRFAKAYKHSDEEAADVLAAYTRYKGDMDQVYENVMLSDAATDDARFRALIDAAIAARDVEAYDEYTQETAASIKARFAAASNGGREAHEAEAYAHELGVHDKLFGEEGAASAMAAKDKGKAPAKKEKDERMDNLGTYLRAREEKRVAALIADMTARYGSKRAADYYDEPTEEEFQAAAARIRSHQSNQNKKARR